MSFLKELNNFEKKTLSRVKTQLTQADGTKVIESLTSGGFAEKDTGERSCGFCVDTKPDDDIYNVKHNLYISSQDGACNLLQLREKNITHILNVATGVPNAYPEEFMYKTVELLDLPETQLEEYLPEIFDFIHEGHKTGAVLVHCSAGVSRSSSVVVAYMMSAYKMSFEDALDIVKQARPCIRPNDGFRRQLQEYEKKLQLDPS